MSGLIYVVGILCFRCISVVALQREVPMAVGNPLRQFREAPAQKEKPMAVGGIGMITTANYVARRRASCYVNCHVLCCMVLLQDTASCFGVHNLTWHMQVRGAVRNARLHRAASVPRAGVCELQLREVCCGEVRHALHSGEDQRATDCLSLDTCPLV